MPRPVFAFLDYSIYTARQEIQHKGSAVPVEPKVYDLILYLLERRDRAVSKEELQEAIWPNVVVTESALTRCVMKARNLLGDSSKSSQVIATVHSRGYRFIAEVSEPDSSASMSGTADVSNETDRVSLAVLPFKNLSVDENQSFLADGLTQDIVTDLSTNPWLMVVSRASSEYYRNRDIDYPTIAAELGANYLVEGSVRRAGDKLRINASLANAATGVTEWSERYDQSTDDFFDIQDDITRHIAASLGSQVRKAEAKRAEKADPESLDVWGLLHRGMAISWSRFSRVSNGDAEKIYRKALALSPDSARAKAFLGCSVAMKVSNGWSTDIDADSAEASQLGTEAVAASPDDAMILTSWGHTLFCLGKAAAAVDVHRHSVAIDPSSAWGTGLLALALIGVGKAEEAIEHIGSALQMSPRDSAVHWYLAMYSWAYVQLGQYEDAAREAQRSINAFGGWQVPWATLAVARAGLGQWQDAEEAARAAANIEDGIDEQGFSRFFGFIVRDADRSEEIGEWLRRIWPRPAET